MINKVLLTKRDLIELSEVIVNQDGALEFLKAMLEKFALLMQSW